MAQLISARFRGVELPDEAWHPLANRHKFRRPVCRLIKALYGHPDAGTMWEQHCHTAVQKVGFKPLGDKWPSLYFHSAMQLLLVIYVDDLKMANVIALINPHTGQPGLNRKRSLLEAWLRCYTLTVWRGSFGAWG